MKPSTCFQIQQHLANLNLNLNLTLCEACIFFKLFILNV